VGNVVAAHRAKGSTPIRSDAYIISVNGARQNEFSYFFKKLMNVVRWSVAYDSTDDTTTKFFDSAEDITNGVPQLVKNGKIDITWEQEKTTKAFVETRHPRTAVAKLKDGKFLMLTADGRTEQSAGLDLYDLAAYMLELGAVDAMNLDGGGSTTMFLDGKVVNRVSDKEGERKIGDAILVTLRNKRKQ
jgi:exopolysaccharide biosynthesis protein